MRINDKHPEVSMKNEKLKYTLPDKNLLDNTESELMVWQPEFPVIVLGQSNTPDKSVLLEKALIDGIPVMQRPSGGEAVLLTPNMLIISLILKGKNLPKSSELFKQVNDLLISGFKDTGLLNVTYRGISDLVINDMKILGSSIYRKPATLFYHAVINYSEAPELIASYLKHPGREPDYRVGRDHAKFITTLKEAGIEINLSLLIEHFQAKLATILN